MGCGAIWLAAYFAGAGHGTYAPAKILFPFTMLFAIYHHSISTAWFMVAFIQFSVYGFLLGGFYHSLRFRLFALGLVAVHFIAVALCFARPAAAFY